MRILEQNNNVEIMDLLAQCEDNSSFSLECHLVNELNCMNEKIDEVSNGLDTLFMIYSGSLIFLMQAGFAMLEAGSVRAKNVKNILLKNLLDACTTAIIFFICGYAFQFGGDETTKSFIGNSGFFAQDLTTASEYSTFFSFYGFSATATTIVACAVAERCQIMAYVLYSIFLAGFIYPVVARSIWSPSGFLTTAGDPSEIFLGVGVIDFAGSGVVHLTGGATALIAVTMLGPRIGRFYDLTGTPLETPHKFQQHSSALQALGTFLLWFGWYGFNAGSTLTISSGDSDTVASLCTVTTTLAAAAGGLTGLYFDTYIEFRGTGEVSYDIVAALNGSLSGLVAITAGGSVVTPWSSIVIGGIGGIFYVLIASLLIKIRLDDVVSAVPVHLVNGTWGLLAVGLFAEESRLEQAGYNSDHTGWFYSWANGSGDATRLLAQFVAVLWIFGWTTIMAIPFFFILNVFDLFRVPPEVELQGLDIVNHGGIAYNLNVSRHHSPNLTSLETTTDDDGNKQTIESSNQDVIEENNDRSVDDHDQEEEEIDFENLDLQQREDLSVIACGSVISQNGDNPAE